MLQLMFFLAHTKKCARTEKCKFGKYEFDFFEERRELRGGKIKIFKIQMKLREAESRMDKVLLFGNKFILNVNCKVVFHTGMGFAVV